MKHPATTATEAELRAQMLRMLEFGVTKRAMAKRLHVHESWLNRWLAKKPAAKITVETMDRFREYVGEFYKTLEETHRSAPPHTPTGAAGSAGSDGSDFHQKGGGKTHQRGGAHTKTRRTA